MLARFFKRYPFTIIAITLGVLYWVSLPRPVHVVGWTMGTRYTVKAFVRFPWLKPELKLLIDRRLVEINQSFSTYQADSELSRFNALASESGFVPTSEFQRVYNVAKYYHQLSNGLFDPTVGPLLRLYGFGAGSKPLMRGPSKLLLEQTLAKVGFDLIREEAGQLYKTKAGVELDFSSIAKGYAVDEIAVLLKSLGAKHYYVEIGGELRVAGAKVNGELWRLGINTPSSASAADAFITSIALRDGALATSGSYRQSQLLGGKQVTHIIHPKTGQATVSELVSVTVLAPTCMQADAMATFLILMPVSEGLALVNRLDKVEALFMTTSRSGYQSFTSAQWPK